MTFFAIHPYPADIPVIVAASVSVFTSLLSDILKEENDLINPWILWMKLYELEQAALAFALARVLTQRSRVV